MTTLRMKINNNWKEIDLQMNKKNKNSEKIILIKNQML